MPANNGIRPNNSERLTGLRKQLADPTQNHLVDGQKWHPTGPTSSQHDDLLSQHQDLGFQRRARSEQIDDNPKNYSAEIQHPAGDHPILRLTPTGWNLRQGQAAIGHDGSPTMSAASWGLGTGSWQALAPTNSVPRVTFLENVPPFLSHTGLVVWDTPHKVITDTALWRRRRWLRVR